MVKLVVPGQVHVCRRAEVFRESDSHDISYAQPAANQRVLLEGDIIISVNGIALKGHTVPAASQVRHMLARSRQKGDKQAIWPAKLAKFAAHTSSLTRALSNSCPQLLRGDHGTTLSFIILRGGRERPVSMVIGDRSKKAHEAGGGEGTDQGSTEVATKGQGLRNVAQRDMRLDAQVDEGEKQEAVSVDKGLESSFAEPRGLFPSSSSRVDGSTGLRSEQVRNRETDRLQEQVYRCRGPQRDAMISSDLLSSDLHTVAVCRDRLG